MPHNHGPFDDVIFARRVKQILALWIQQHTKAVRIFARHHDRIDNVDASGERCESNQAQYDSGQLRFGHRLNSDRACVFVCVYFWHRCCGHLLAIRVSGKTTLTTGRRQAIARKRPGLRRSSPFFVIRRSDRAARSVSLQPRLTHQQQLSSQTVQPNQAASCHRLNHPCCSRQHQLQPIF